MGAAELKARPVDVITLVRADDKSTEDEKLQEDQQSAKKKADGILAFLDSIRPSASSTDSSSG